MDTDIDDHNEAAAEAPPTGELNLLKAAGPPRLPDAHARETRPMLAWLRDECPVDSVSFGNLTFHKRIDVPGADGKRFPIPGQILQLSKSDIDLAEAELKTRVLRSFFEVVDGKRQRRGQQDVALFRWSRPGVGPDGGPFLDPVSKKPITEATLVPVLNAKHSSNDEPWSSYVVLEDATPEMQKFYERMGQKRAVDVVAEARAWNEKHAEEDAASLAKDAGLSRKRSAVTTVAGRLD